MYFKLAIATIIPVLIAVIFKILDKKTKFGKLKPIVKQIIIGLVFAVNACLATQYGIHCDSYVLNVRSASPLIAGLLFGPVAGIISGVIGCIYRVLSTLWGVATYTTFACSAATLLAGLIGSLAYKYLFEGKKIRWFYGLFLGMTTEVIHMLLVFLTHMNEIYKAFSIVSATTIYMVTANSIAVVLAIVFTSLIDKKKHEKINNEEKTIANKFASRLCIAILIAYFVTSLFTYQLQKNISQYDVENTLKMNISDVQADIEDSSDMSLLTVTQSILDTLKDDVGDLYAFDDSTKEAYRSMLIDLADTYHVTDINIIDTTGVIVISNNVEMDNFNLFNRTDGQAFEFRCLVYGNETSYVQSYGPIDMDPSISRKYCGIKTDNGFIQVGYGHDTLQDQINSTLELMAKNRHIKTSGFIFIMNEQTLDVISAPDNSVTEENIEKFKTVIDDFKNLEVVEFNGADEVEYFLMLEKAEGYIIVGAIPVSECLFTSNVSVYIGIFMLVVVFASLFTIVYLLIKKSIVKNMDSVNESLSLITSGNINTIVNVKDTVEFDNLSNYINLTVSRLKDFIKDAEDRINKELEFAKSIQSSALPSVFPDRKEFDIYAEMKTAKEVGGDFYDFYFVGENKLIVLIADVSGKGIPAAMFMMRVKTMLKSMVESGIAIDEAFTKANQKLCESNDAGMFVTCWMGLVDISTGVVSYVNAGHNPPIVSHNGKYEYLQCKPGFVLAGIDGMVYKKYELKLEVNDRLFLYTDGLTESTNEDNKLLGEAKVLEVLNGKSYIGSKDIIDTLFNTISEFVKDTPRSDDITMLAFTYKGNANCDEITIDATIENIETVTEFVDKKLEELECPMKALMQINVAIDELFSNIAHYSYKPEIGPATVRVEVESDPLSVIISFIDHGKPFDPLAKEDPDVTTSAEDREIGGLGIFMVKKTMDDVYYEYKNGQNILTIKKNI